MSPGRTDLSQRRRLALAIGAALLLHAVLLGVMGLIRPQFEYRGFDDRPPVELQLLSPGAAGLPPSGVAARQARPVAPSLVPHDNPLSGLAVPTLPPDRAASAPPSLAEPQAEAQARSTANAFPGFFNGEEPGCGTEDVDLLAPDEKQRCRNQVDVARARRAQAAADAERAARMAAMRLLPRVDGLAPEKRAYYDAVAEANRSVREEFGKGLPSRDDGAKGLMGNYRSHIDMSVSARCTLSFGVNMGKPALHCPHALPSGFLTEESRVAPP